MYTHIYTLDENDCAVLLQICLKHRGPWDLEIFWGPPCFGAVGWLCVWNLGAVFFVSSLLPTCHFFFDGSPGIARILLEEFHEILQYHVFKCGLVALLIPCRFMIPVFWDLSSHKIPSHPATVQEVLEHDIRLVRQQVPKHLGKITIADTYGGARCPTSSG